MDVIKEIPRTLSSSKVEEDDTMPSRGGQEGVIFSKEIFLVL